MRKWESAPDSRQHPEVIMCVCRMATGDVMFLMFEAIGAGGRYCEKRKGGSSEVAKRKGDLLDGVSATEFWPRSLERVSPPSPPHRGIAPLQTMIHVEMSTSPSHCKNRLCISSYTSRVIKQKH